MKLSPPKQGNLSDSRNAPKSAKISVSYVADVLRFPLLKQRWVAPGLNKNELRKDTTTGQKKKKKEIGGRKESELGTSCHKNLSLENSMVCFKNSFISKARCFNFAVGWFVQASSFFIVSRFFVLFSFLFFSCLSFNVPFVSGRNWRRTLL